MAIPACVLIPGPPTPPSVTFIGGAKFSGFLDFSQGLPNNCSVTFNLLGQLSGALGSIECLLRVMKVMGALSDALGPPPDPSKLAGPLAELAECIQASLPGVSMALTIRSILGVIVSFLHCLLGELDAIVQARAKIDFSIAANNPALAEILSCAQANADQSAQYLIASIAPIQPLLDIVGGLPGAPGLPNLASISQETNLEVVVQSIQGVLAALEPLAA